MSLLLYSTYNEQGSHDLSENGYDGTVSGVTYAAGDVGYNAVFNADTDQINYGDVSGFNGQSIISFYIRGKFLATAGTNYVLTKDSVILCTWDGTDLVVTVNGVSVTAPLDVDTYYSIHYIYDNSSSRVELYVNNSLIDLDTPSGNTASAATDLKIGMNTDATEPSARFEINELKLFNNTLTSAQRQSQIDNINGIDISIYNPSIFNVGDILVCNENISPKYAICTFSEGNFIKIQPITSGILPSMLLTRVGHLWDTNRQYYVRLTDKGVKYYQNVSLSSEANTDAKLTRTDTVLSNEIIDKGTVDTDQNNYDLTQEQDLIVLQPDANRTITGIVAPTYARRIIIINDSAFNLQYDNQSASSTAANRIIVGKGSSHTQQGGTTIELLYDTINSRWRIINE